MRIEEAGEALELPVSWLRRQVRDGGIPSVKIGSSIFVKEAAVVEAVQRMADGEGFGVEPEVDPETGEAVGIS